MSSNRDWDVFISHAHEDKDTVVRPLAHRLISRGLRVWIDEHTLMLGDSLRTKIDEGLAHSRYGIVILSPSFFAKHWPQRELDGLIAREGTDSKVVLPVWHDVTQDYVRARSPLLAGRVAAHTERGIEYVAQEILRVVRHSSLPSNPTAALRPSVPTFQRPPLTLMHLALGVLGTVGVGLIGVDDSILGGGFHPFRVVEWIALTQAIWVGLLTGHLTNQSWRLGVLVVISLLAGFSYGLAWTKHQGDFSWSAFLVAGVFGAIFGGGTFFAGRWLFYLGRRGDAS
jgi:hypothetical protein